MQNKSRYSVWIIASVLILILGVSSYMTLFAEKSTDTVKLSVILSDSSSDRWTAAKQGMDQAALDNNIEITYITTDHLDSITEELSILRREIDNGAEAIIFEPIATEGYSDFLNENKANCSIVLYNSDVKPQNVYAKIEADNNKIGTMLYESVSSIYEGRLDKLKVGIITGHSSEEAVEERRKSLLIHEDLKNCILWEVNVESMSDTKFASLVKEKPVDVIIALGSYETEKTIDYCMSCGLDKKVDIIGAGYSEKAIYYMDLETVTSLVLTDEFNQGYLSVEAAYNQLKKGVATQKTIEEVFRVERENLYDEEYQKVLFPVVQ